MSTIRDMTAGDVEGLLQLYNELVSHLPNYRVAELAEFGEALECSSRYGELANARLVVGEVDGQLVGFAHVATGSFEDIHEREQSGGVIHFLGYRPGHRVVGQGLLAAAEDHARQYGMSEMWAFQADMGYGFNHLGFGNATDRMGHVGALFQANGYGVNEEFVWLRWDDYSIAEPEPPGDEYEVVLSEAGARGLTLDLRLNGEESGGCWAFPKDAYDGTGKWLYTKGLAVELAPFSINVNAVCPGAVWTRFQQESIKGRGHGRGLGALPAAEDAVGRAASRVPEEPGADAAGQPHRTAAVHQCGVPGLRHRSGILEGAVDPGGNWDVGSATGSCPFLGMQVLPFCPTSI